MRVVVVGAGPTGLFTAMALARRGHEVTVVDRDPGPQPDGSWSRRGVMQFHHPHAFRAQVVEALRAELPEVWSGLLTAGAQPIVVPNGSGGPEQVMGIRCRRLTFERVLRGAAACEPGVALRVGHVDDVCIDRGRATGVRVDGESLDADLVVAASGRAGRLGRDLRAPAQGGDCGIAYVSRQYRLNPDAPPGPMNSPLGQVDLYPGYQVIVFLHDDGIFSATIVRSSHDGALAALRSTEVFEAAARAIPALSDWTDPARARPHTPALPGARLHNTFQGQLDHTGTVALPGLIFVGDSVCTTNPAVGRGITTSLLQARELLRLVEEDPHDVTAHAPAGPH
jgi:2-polyprenyl-6-methoxyphenol hydroxylase-like FAD-dependent oxidoreductase